MAAPTTRHFIQLLPLTAPAAPVVPSTTVTPNRLPLELFAEVTTASGTRFKWGANQPPGSRLQNLSFRTKIGEGFSDASGSLSRRIDQDYPDLNLVDTITFTGADGSVAYEGRVSSMPRELGDHHSIGLTLVGWMAHAKDRKFTEIYVDRDLGAWSGMRATRRSDLLAANFNPFDGASAAAADNTAAINTALTGDWVSPYKPASEAWYDAGPDSTIAKIGYGWARSASISVADTNWAWKVAVSSDDRFTGSEFTSSLLASGPAAGSTFSPSARFRYGVLQLTYAVTSSGGSGTVYSIDWTKLAVYGNHGLTLYTGEPSEPAGVLASDVMKEIAGRFCPQLDVSGVQQSSYVIQHCAFKDRTFPYDAFLELNKYQLWRLAVWENRRLDYGPYDLSDYDWEIRTDDAGTTFAPQGPSTESLFNGISVTYTDVLTGLTQTLNPDTYRELADTSTSNPWNTHGVPHWDEITLSSPTLAATALQIGRAALADRNAPKTPGTITVRGYIRDRQGNEQPVWKVRAGDTISVTNFPNDSPRLIVETDYDDEQKSISLAIDKPFALIDAYLDRQANALQAAGLGG